MIKLRILIEKRFMVKGISGCITVRSKGTLSLSFVNIQKGDEIVLGDDFTTLAKVDFIRAIASDIGIDAIVVENVICESTAMAYKEAGKYDESLWNIDYGRGTKDWTKETSKD